jgi:hypothetical protein
MRKDNNNNNSTAQQQQQFIDNDRNKPIGIDVAGKKINRSSILVLSVGKNSGSIFLRCFSPAKRFPWKKFAWCFRGGQGE